MNRHPDAAQSLTGCLFHSHGLFPLVISHTAVYNKCNDSENAVAALPQGVFIDNHLPPELLP